MKWTIFIQQKIKVAMLLLCIMFFVILTNLLGSNNLDNINRSVNSIYNDRLIPATDVYYISDYLHKKKSLLDNIVITKGEYQKAVAELKDINVKISRLVAHYENTYLVNGEIQFISDFKTTYNAYNTTEAGIIRLIKAGEVSEAQHVLNNDVSRLHHQNIQTLGKLVSIQSNVGRDLIKQSESNANIFSLLSSLQIILAIVIGGMVVRLVMASRLTNAVHEKYTMN
ncbi:MAG: hypothetical protein EOP47_17485 [Sphingobacteriaceae bacterium]|nr:MAG: hypothetical protein EOP47_17485 [Sphingobacteriaceae bacterium]